MWKEEGGEMMKEEHVGEREGAKRDKWRRVEKSKNYEALESGRQRGRSGIKERGKKERVKMKEEGRGGRREEGRRKGEEEGIRRKSEE